ncbi:MAG: hypothetical protein JKY96_01065 [Phycisphaerales bacterium]|nr:hypothetical protein [Phycisphaerales bacterium]
MGETPRNESGSTRRLCVVLHAEGKSADSGLVRALKKRNMQVLESANPHEVFARICNDERGGRKPILVLDGDGPRSLGDRLIDAMERFTPAAVCWNHLPGANPPIQPVVGPLGAAIDAAATPAVEEQAPISVPERVVAGPAPKLRLTEPQVGQARRSPVSATDVLDADELDALLAQEMPKKNDGV